MTPDYQAVIDAAVAQAPPITPQQADLVARISRAVDAVA